MQKKVSVIIPFYNGVDWLGEAVQSVLDQTYTNIEIIVVNDGSQDDMTSFLESYGDKVLYIRQENQGPAAARNNGISHATGDYIAFEDADDVWLPSKLEKQIGFMEERGFMWSHTGYYNWWPIEGKLVVVNNYNDYDDMRRQIKVSCRIATPSVVVNRKVLDNHPQIRFLQDLRVGEDTAFYSQLSQLYSLALIQEPLLKVRMRSNKSYKNVIKRFEHRAKDYLTNKEDMTPIMRFNGKLYVLYYNLFKMKRNPFTVFFAKCCMALPYSIERVYIKWLILTSKKDERYLLKWDRESS